MCTVYALNIVTMGVNSNQRLTVKQPSNMQIARGWTDWRTYSRTDITSNDSECTFLKRGLKRGLKRVEEKRRAVGWRASIHHVTARKQNRLGELLY